MMTYKEARAYIQQVSKTGSILGLESIRALMAELSNVQDQIPVIHIAGTNGKGSVGAYLDAILREAGYHVGRYCSPAVFDPLEVWQYDGTNMSENEYAEVMSQVKSACDILVPEGRFIPTVFEIETAAAFVYFHRKKVDFLLLETGMGGETDATNVIAHPAASVITTISMDHMQFLGETLAKIASVKAGIIKENAPVISAIQEKEVEQVLRDRAKKCSSPISFVDRALLDGGSQSDWKLETVKGNSKTELAAKENMTFSYRGLLFSTQMVGQYQRLNAALALEVTRNLPGIHLDPEILQRGISRAYWPGRFEILGRTPYFIIDGAHNEDAAGQLAQTLENHFTNKSFTYIIGVLADKEHEKILRIMQPFSDRVYIVTPDNPRAMDGKLLAKEAKKYYTFVSACESVEEAVRCALKDAVEDDSNVLAFGSLSYLKQVKEAYEIRYWNQIAGTNM